MKKIIVIAMIIGIAVIGFVGFVATNSVEETTYGFDGNEYTFHQDGTTTVTYGEGNFTWED